MPLPSFTPDITIKLKDAGAITADAAWQVGGANAIWDLGSATYTPFAVHVSITAIEVDTTDEVYRLWIQGSSSATFASTIVNLACLEVGAAAAVSATADVGHTAGYYSILAHNESDGVNYRYIRGYTDVTGTLVTGINFDAWGAFISNAG